MDFIKQFENFSEKVWRKIEFYEVVSITEDRRELTEREKSFLINNSDGFLTKNDMNREFFDVDFLIRAISDGYYYLSFRVFIYGQPVFFDFTIDGINNLVKYASFGKYLNGVDNKSDIDIDIDYFRNNFDIDEEFISLFLQ